MNTPCVSNLRNMMFDFQWKNNLNYALSGTCRKTMHREWINYRFKAWKVQSFMLRFSQFQLRKYACTQCMSFIAVFALNTLTQCCADQSNQFAPSICCVNVCAVLSAYTTVTDKEENTHKYGHKHWIVCNLFISGTFTKPGPSASWPHMQRL
jgi:hypothetical protein